jgi:hypothetical protein
LFEKALDTLVVQCCRTFRRWLVARPAQQQSE